MKMSSAPMTFTSRRASRGTVDFYIGVIRSKADNIKNLCNNCNRDYVLKLSFSQLLQCVVLQLLHSVGIHSTLIAI